MPRPAKCCADQCECIGLGKDDGPRSWNRQSRCNRQAVDHLYIGIRRQVDRLLRSFGSREGDRIDGYKSILIINLYHSFRSKKKKNRNKRRRKNLTLSYCSTIFYRSNLVQATGLDPSSCGKAHRTACTCTWPRTRWQRKASSVALLVEVLLRSSSLPALLWASLLALLLLLSRHRLKLPSRMVLPRLCCCRCWCFADVQVCPP